MYGRVEYEMSEVEMKEILDACKPTPVMYLSGGVNIGGDPQENANRAWKELGEKMGFDHMTVRPITGKGIRFFSAIPSETTEAKTEREKVEQEQKVAIRKQQLQKIIADAEAELSLI